MQPDEENKVQEEIDEAKEKEAKSVIESILFVSGKFLDMKALITLSDMNPIIIREILEDLKKSYDERESAIRIIEKNGMWKMDVKQEFANITTRLAGGSSEFTKAEQETLAIIAFKQPIKQSVIVKIRGNKAYDHIKKFSELDLVNKKRQGHTHELTLSQEFYDYFGVSEPKTPEKTAATEMAETD
ncbi:MAG: SMC-Scp complex subunit ScpB [Nanoarchaeota archaeon]